MDAVSELTAAAYALKGIAPTPTTLNTWSSAGTPFRSTASPARRRTLIYSSRPTPRARKRPTLCWSHSAAPLADISVNDVADHTNSFGATPRYCRPSQCEGTARLITGRLLVDACAA